ncbi:MAG: MATE family efflux transporter, partial [Thermoplasmatales archaeon]|nr:MATE family efflux transporter [Thermoplasmatales archaeon]
MESAEGQKTKGVDTLLGDPKKAIIALSVPYMIAMIAQTANNLIDSAWVAGLGPDALAAVGFVFPLYFILVGVGNGVGVGAAS